MIRRPPKLTPFPSTTLSRCEATSRKDARVTAGLRGSTLQTRAGHTLDDLALEEQEHDYERQPREHGRGHDVRVADAVDRKSTRLNSSHANISYAVFCLKKKK